MSRSVSKDPVPALPEKTVEKEEIKMSTELKERLRQKKLAMKRKAKDLSMPQLAVVNRVKEQIEHAMKVAEIVEDDPLDAFMKETTAKARSDIKEAEEKEAVEARLVNEGGDIEAVSEAVQSERQLKAGHYQTLLNNNKRCYVCKKYGHTKTDCPEKRCLFCFQKYHVRVDCPKWKAELERRADVDKQNRRHKFYEEKKRRRREERLDELRRATGVYGFKKLYRILELPEHKLATESDLKKAYQRLALIWHPDKHVSKTEEEISHAQDKFEKIKDAYDLLTEGLENGHLEGTVVASRGNLADLDNNLKQFMERNVPGSTKPGGSH